MADILQMIFLNPFSMLSEKKNSVLQAQLWDQLVLRTILVFLFSGMHTDHDLQAFFAKQSPQYFK